MLKMVNNYCVTYLLFFLCIDNTMSLFFQLEANRRSQMKKNLLVQKVLEMEILLILQHVGDFIR